MKEPLRIIRASVQLSPAFSAIVARSSVLFRLEVPARLGNRFLIMIHYALACPAQTAMHRRCAAVFVIDFGYGRAFRHDIRTKERNGGFQSCRRQSDRSVRQQRVGRTCRIVFPRKWDRCLDRRQPDNHDCKFDQSLRARSPTGCRTAPNGSSTNC
jgi:hypothetical protein